jgi:hypothetical protein
MADPRILEESGDLCPYRFKSWAEGGSNSHDRSRHILSVVRLPIPPSARFFNFTIILHFAGLQDVFVEIIARVAASVRR